MQGEGVSAAHRLAAKVHLRGNRSRIFPVLVDLRGVSSISWEEVEGYGQGARRPVCYAAEIPLLSMATRHRDKFPGLAFENARLVPRHGNVTNELKGGLAGIGLRAIRNHRKG